MQWARPALKIGMGASPRSIDRCAQAWRCDLCVSAGAQGRSGQCRRANGRCSRFPRSAAPWLPWIPTLAECSRLSVASASRKASSIAPSRRMRQPGSTLKPLIYTTAIDNGYTPASIVVDGPITISRGPGLPPWQPKNYEAGEAAGPATLRFGIEHSRNLMTVRLARDMGMPIICEYTRRFGVYDNLMPILPMALGAGETTLTQDGQCLRDHRQWRQGDEGHADRSYPGSLRPCDLAP